MKITEALLRDHELFYRRFDELERTLAAPGAFDSITPELYELDATLGAHAQLEDELLFAALEPFLGQAGPLGVMRMEHDEIESTLARLHEAVALPEVSEQVPHLLEVARSHFMKEEQILFPLSEQILNPEQLNELGARFESRRRVVLI